MAAPMKDRGTVLKICCLYNIEPELRWTTLHPEHWTTNEVRSWLDYVAERYNIPLQDHTSLSDEFGDINGPHLLHMSLDDFLIYSPQYGRLLFDVFSNMCNNAPNVQSPHTEGVFPLPPILEDNSTGQSGTETRRSASVGKRSDRSDQENECVKKKKEVTSGPEKNK